MKTKNPGKLPTAAEIGARPDDWMPTAADVGAQPSIAFKDRSSAVNIGAAFRGWTGSIRSWGLVHSITFCVVTTKDLTNWTDYTLMEGLPFAVPANVGCWLYDQEDRTKAVWVRGGDNNVYALNACMLGGPTVSAGKTLRGHLCFISEW